MIHLFGTAQEPHVPVTPHHHHIFNKDRKVPIDFFRLGDIGNDILSQSIFYRHTQHCNFTFGRRHEPHNRLEQRGLTRTIYPHQCGDRPSGNFKAGVAQGRVAVAIGDCDVICGDAS